ncbi:hypothetical protein [Deinococcus koreensis]|uniref:Uncharacterized protein n=1 Tax=Deinococcus koreensis TaxID=2054903 RepID=A0A2K3UUN8_9DEIO|nr:hypothetical protein [Deinococcus koreensis]PNY80251.1 hypothetical protein CVO96_01740 [Deinococcus koreensis]
MLPAHLHELVEFHAPLSTLQRGQGGAVTLLTPGVNVLALNATFLPDDLAGADLDGPDLDAVRNGHEGQGLPALMASGRPLAGAREVARLVVGAWAPAAVPAPSDVVVEQVSRLHLGTWAAVLASAHGTPGWAQALARHLAPRLEGDRQSVLLMAYRAGEAVGALLWRRGAAHLWGAADGHAARPLLDAAFALEGTLRVSVAGAEPLQLTDPRPVIYSVLD